MTTLELLAVIFLCAGYVVLIVVCIFAIILIYFEYKEHKMMVRGEVS